MYVALLLAITQLVARQDDLLGYGLLGKTPREVTQRLPSCTVSSDARGDGTLAAVCHLDFIGKPATVTFGFNGLQRASAWSVAFDNKLSAAEANAAFNAITAQLGRNFPQRREQAGAGELWRLFVAPTKAMAWAKLAPAATAGAQVFLVVRVVPIANATEAPRGFELPAFRL